MAYLHVMAVAHSTDQLLKEIPGLILTEPSTITDSIEQLPACCELHDNHKMRWRQYHLLEANDVGVAQRAVVDDLPVHILIYPVAALDALDGDELAGLAVAHQPR
ncbi:hypothetical protein L9G15_20420, partial [Shewanella sp. A3A]|nr:hypothetical protein [Shewanella ferrihydritica]